MFGVHSHLQLSVQSNYLKIARVHITTLTVTVAIWLSCRLRKVKLKAMPGILFVGIHIHFLAALSVRPFCLLINFEVKPQLDFLLLNCSGNTPETRGTAFVVYEDIFDAKNACDHLSGFNVCNRYLVVLYYQSTKVK